MTEPARVRAPDFVEGLPWHNSEPLSLRKLRGRVVLLDFWTHCCINCIHVLEQLKRLEERFGERLVVIGVHSAKFPNERRDESVAAAVRRLEITHPVVNDAGFEMWQRYAVRAWPTLVLIDPEGRVIGEATGEGNEDLLTRAIERLLELHPAAGSVDELRVTCTPPREGLLSFPGKVICDGERLAVSDTNHHRLLLCTPDGRVQQTIGSGVSGDEDGAFEAATFCRPQGLALDGTHLFVADTGNHLIRYCNLRSGRVATAAGTGVQHRDYGRWGMSEALEASLSSPWDLLLHRGRLFIAMAGPHQVWVLDLAADQVGPYSGSGHEDCRDGGLNLCAMAQPSGLATDGRVLFVADSETSSIRTVPLDGSGEVGTLVGEGLFEFGDRDGRLAGVRLQHPMGLSFDGGRLYIADTYNHKIKVYDPKRGSVKTLFGSTAGDDEGHFDEPSGLAVVDGVMFVADTNNHRVCRAEIASGRINTVLG